MEHPQPLIRSFTAVAVSWFACTAALAADWPQWRFDASRGAVSPSPLPTDLTLHWERQLTPSCPAWPSTQPKLQFDVAAHPVAAGKTLIVNSSVNDSVTALETRTGRLKWTYYTNGPVRFAPIVAGKRVYCVSDDGHLYCLEMTTGKLIWKFNGAPRSRWILGNERLISTWPARGGPVLHDGKIFFAASIWPFMGVFIHAIDAQAGRPLWTNSGDGTNLTVQPHGAPSFATVAPQGHLVVANDKLIVPGGRSVPAVYDATDGRLVHFNYDKSRGGHFVSAAGDEYFVDGGTYDLTTGWRVEDLAPVVAGPEAVIFAAKHSLAGKSPRMLRHTRRKTDRRGEQSEAEVRRRNTLFAHQIDGPLGSVHMQTGSLLWAAAEGEIRAFNLQNISPLRPIWRHAVPGEICEAIAADNRLFVVTRDNRLFCFGPGPRPSVRHELQRAQRKPIAGAPSTRHVEKMLEHCRSRHGYAIILGIGSGALVDQLIAQTQYSLIVIDSDRASVQAFRRRMQSTQHYGRRVCALEGNISPRLLPPYLASLILSESADEATRFCSADEIVDWFEVLRPFGGKLVLPIGLRDHAKWNEQLRETPWHGARWSRNDQLSILERAGPLPETDDWSHQYGNAAQTGISLDHRVKAPLGILWFGGPSNDGILPRHGHGPAPQVAGGRIIIEGPDLLRCLDVYTGRLLWERELKSLGSYYNTTRHFSGAGEIGSNYVSLPDSIYAVFGAAILKLDAATGKTVAEYHLAESKGGACFGFVSAWGDLLVATSTPVGVSTSNLSETRSKEPIVLDDEKPIIAPAAAWSYLAGRDPTSDWTRVDYRASHWKTGRAGFGYGDDDDRTVLDDMVGKYNRVYLRRAFTDTAVANVRQLTLLIRFDDAFIAYLNGTEVARSSITGKGQSAKVEMHEAGKFQMVPLKDWQSLIRPGKNVLAIEAHNIGLASSDFTIDPYLVGQLQATNNSTAPARLEDFLQPTRFASGSRRLVVFNRHTGRELWHRDAEFNFRHNNIAVGGGKVFCIDRLSDAKQSSLERRGVRFNRSGRLLALEANSGRVVWQTKDQVFGTFLNYSAQHDTLVQGGSAFRDRADDDVTKGIVAYRGRDGLVRWSNEELSYDGPLLLWQDQILTNGLGGIAFDLLSGRRTGWQYERAHGCNTAVGCQNLLTFRSGAAGFYDLLHRSGTGNLGGFRSSCTNNLIPANGVLAAPDYTRTCTCAYQNQTSLALVHMPEAEYWTCGGTSSDRMGLNFGAPGDRRDARGTLWVDFPSVGGPSPTMNAEVLPPDTRSFRQHASTVSGHDAWIAASGLEGVRQIRLRLDSNAIHQLRFVFLEPQSRGQRRFDVKIQGQTRLEGFSPRESAGEIRSSVSRTFYVRPKHKTIMVEFLPRSSRQPVISGLEVIKEGS